MSRAQGEGFCLAVCAVAAMALGFAAAVGTAAQRGFSPAAQQLNQNNSFAQAAANFPCAAYNRISFFDIATGGPGLDAAQAQKAQELEARSVAASLKLSAAVVDKLVTTYQASRSGLDTECVQRQVEVLSAPRGPGVTPAALLQSLPDEWKAKMQNAFREFLTAADSARAAEALGLFRSGPRWDRLVDAIAEFNLDGARQATALAAIRSYVVEVDAMGTGNAAAALEQESKAKLDRELSQLLTPSQAGLWAARTTAANVAGNAQFFQSAVAGVTVSGRLINPAAATTARQNPPQPAQINPAISGRGGGAPPNNLSFLGGARGTAEVQFLSVDPETIPGDDRGGRGGRGGGGSSLTINNNRNTLRLQVQDNGAFQVGVVPPGRYRVIASATVDNVRLSAAQYFDVRSNDVAGINLTLRPAVEVRGQIYLAAGETLPENFTAAALPVRLMPTAPRGNMMNPSVSPNSDLSFRFTGLQQTPYRVDFGGRGNAAAYLVRGAYGAADPLKSPVEFSGGSELLKLEVGFAAARVDGIAMNQDAPFPSATVVLAPQDRWRRDRYRLTTAGDDGQFSFETVAPGDYKVFAWKISHVAYGDPSYPANIENVGRSVHVEKTGAASARVQVILDDNSVTP